MKKRIAVLTKNPRLYNKIRLLLRHDCETVMLDEWDGGSYSLILLDADTCEVPSVKCKVMSSNGGDIPLPFSHEELLLAVADCDNSIEPIALLPDERSARIDGETVKLTELEYKLLAILLESDGYVPREKLLSRVWGEGFDPGVVNVYVYYLRQKLEKNGRKIILSSRKLGYGIDEKYRRVD